MVILGPTGRNLAAGMTGGLAHVLDLRPELVNRVDVDLVPPDDDTTQWLHDVVRRHARETRSTLAAALLADWPGTVSRFTTIYPRQYRRVVEVMAEARDVSGDPDTVLMKAVMEASHG